MAFCSVVVTLQIVLIIRQGSIDLVKIDMKIAVELERIHTEIEFEKLAARPFAYARILPSDWESTKWTDLPQDRFESFSQIDLLSLFEAARAMFLVASS